MSPTRFVFCVHNHQPVGNFGYVIEEAYAKSYDPFLAALERHPGVRIVMHTTGPLWDWIVAERPEYVERVAALVARGQVEMLTGGYYEPILPAVPRADAIGQIRKLTGFVQEKLGATARGAWLAERVWEPSLPSLFAEAGVEFVAVDDTHFRRAGLLDPVLGPYYLTEDQGARLNVFPIDKELRYKIPYDSPEGAVGYLRDVPRGSTLVLADDGEKFGVWPNTYKAVFEDGWLEQFFTLLEAARGDVDTAHFGEVLADTTPRGLVYLPTASYMEMMEWALPVPTQAKLEELHHRLEERGELAGNESLLAGGFWRMFFARYPESNRLHKRVQQIRRRWEAVPRTAENAVTLERALDELWQAECNCPYWHGVFGGLYLPHLRGAAATHALEADAILEGLAAPDGAPHAALADVDCDGHLDAELRGGGTLVHADRFGRVHAFEVASLHANLADVVARRPELYHSKVHEAVLRVTDGEVRTIHGSYTTKEEGLERLLTYDAESRGLFVERLVAALDAETLEAAHARVALAHVREPLAVEATAAAASARVELVLGAAAWPVRKEVRVTREGALEARYAFGHSEALDDAQVCAVEMSLSLFRDTSPCTAILADGTRRPLGDAAVRHVLEECVGLDIVDDVRGGVCALRWDRADACALYPVETVSLSEDGFERVLQGVCVTPAWRAPRVAGQSVTITVHACPQAVVAAGTSPEAARR